MEAIGLKNSTLLLYNYNSSSTGALPLLPPLLPLPLCTTAAKSTAYLTPLSSSSASSSSSSSWKLSMLRTTTTAIKTPTATRRMKRSGPEVVRKSTITCCGGGAMIKNINESEFASVVLESERPVLVEFVADWCGPCRLISPSMEWAAQEYRDRLMIVKIDHDANPQLIQKYEVYGLPTLILFKNGQEVPTSRKEGAITKVKLKNYLDVLLDSVSVA